MIKLKHRLLSRFLLEEMVGAVNGKCGFCAGSKMEKDILTAIVEVEKEIQVRLAAERKGADERLAQVKRESEGEIRKEEGRLKVALQEVLAAARADAERKGTVLVEDAAAQAERLTRLDDRTLREIIARHLIRILPGRGDDRQNVQG